jgi:hypothetical protein
MPSQPQGASSQERFTVREQPQAMGTRRDAAPQPTPVVPWPSNTTLGSAASQSVAPAAPTRRRAPLIASIVLGVAGAGGVGAYIALRKPAADAPKPAVQVSKPDGNDAVQPSLTITTDPPGAVVRIDGSHRGPSPVTLPVSRGSQITVEVVRDGYEPAKQVVTIAQDAQSVMIPLRALPSVPADAATVVTAPPPDARPATTPAKPPKKTTKPVDTHRQQPGDKFNPDDVVD